MVKRPPFLCCLLTRVSLERFVRLQDLPEPEQHIDESESLEDLLENVGSESREPEAAAASDNAISSREAECRRIRERDSC